MMPAMAPTVHGPGEAGYLSVATQQAQQAAHAGGCGAQGCAAPPRPGPEPDQPASLEGQPGGRGLLLRASRIALHPLQPELALHAGGAGGGASPMSPGSGSGGDHGSDIFPMSPVEAGGMHLYASGAGAGPPASPGGVPRSASVK